MLARDELLFSLLGGLPEDDQVLVLQILERAREAQVERKRNPPRRRRRNADGALVTPSGPME